MIYEMNIISTKKRTEIYKRLRASEIYQKTTVLPTFEN